MCFCGFHGYLCQVPTETLVAPLLLLDDKPLEVHKHHFSSHGARASALRGARGFHGARSKASRRRELVVRPDQQRWKPSVAVQMCRYSFASFAWGSWGSWWILGRMYHRNSQHISIQDEPECDGCEAWKSWNRILSLLYFLKGSPYMVSLIWAKEHR